jgi:uncharacterized protein
MADPNTGKRKPACPVCGKPRLEAFQPFCSDRCKTVDLNRWLTERYRVPVSAPDETESDEPND